MTGVASRCIAMLRQASLTLGLLLLCVAIIPLQIEPLQFPWQVVGERLPMWLTALPGIGLVMALLGLASAPLLLTRTLVALLAGVGVLGLLAWAAGTDALPGLGAALVLTGLVLFGAAGAVRRVAPWSNVARGMTALAMIAALVAYLVPGIAGDAPLVVTVVRGLRGGEGTATVLGLLALVPLLLAAVSVATLLPPESSPPALARLVGVCAVLLLPVGTAVTMLAAGEPAGKAASVTIILLAGMAWSASGIGVLVLGLLAGEEPEEDEHWAPRADDDPLRYFEDGTRQMEAFVPETAEDEGETTRMIQSPAELIARSRSTARPRPAEPPPERQPRQRPDRPESAKRTTVRDSRPTPPDDDPEPPSADRTVILDRPFGKKRR